MGAKDNGKQGRAAATLAALEAQRGALVAEQDRLAGTKVNAVKDLEQATAVHARRLAITQALTDLDQELGPARAAAEREQEALQQADQAAALAAASEQLHAELRTLAGLLESFAAQRTRVLIAQRAVQAAGGYIWPQVYPVLKLDAALRTLHAEWSRQAPELLGLPPRPTAREQRIADAEHDVRMAEKHLAEQRQAYSELRARPGWDPAPGVTSRAEEVLKEAVAGVVRAKRHLAKVRGDSGAARTEEELEAEALFLANDERSVYFGKPLAEIVEQLQKKIIRGR